MKRWGGLYALLGLLSGVALGRWLAWPRTRTGLQSAEAESCLTGDRQRLTRADVLRMIEENGSPQGLQLVDQDLSTIDLGYKAIRQELERRGITHAGRIPWYSAETNGANLRGVNLKGANLCGANLFQVDLSFANLHSARLEDAILCDARLIGCVLIESQARNADFSSAMLEDAYLMRAELQHATFNQAKLAGADFERANLQDCSFWEAKLQGARFFFADMSRAVLWDANLENADLAEADLTGVNLFGARLLNTYLTREQLRDTLNQDSPTYQDPVPKQMPARWGRHRQAKDIYLALKNNFYSLGLYGDGSWAYFRERQTRKALYNPRRAHRYCAEEMPGGIPALSWRWWQFYAKYTGKWLIEWATELSCGYGERPQRVIALAGFILTVFPLIFWIIGGVGQYDPALGHDIPSLNFLDYIIYSAGAFATTGFEGLKPINTAAQIWTAVEAILGISVLALLMFTLGNRISRS